MSKQTIQYFFLGVLIAFSVSVVFMTTIMTFANPQHTLQVELVWQSLALSCLCSLINMVYQSERLGFVWQSVIGYILTTSTIFICGFYFGWFSFERMHIDRTAFLIVFFLICTLFYLITWIIIWKVNKAKKIQLNRKLQDFKNRQ